MVYDLDEPFEPTTLTLTGTVIVEPTDDLLFDRLGHDITSAALQAVKNRGVFHMALSGGSTPEPFYMRLCTDPRFRIFPWEATHLWIVDERRVPDDDHRLNFRMIKDVLVDHVPVRKRNVHPMPVMDEKGDEAYEAELRKAVPSGKLDFVLLGMGDDGHTASLFPNSPAVHEQDRWIVGNDGEHVTPPPRMTMTYPLLNAARMVGILATKAKKSAMLHEVDSQLAGVGPDAQKYPITGIAPRDGQLRWYLDAAAAARPTGA